ncbi:MAG TPA: carboxypeptidase-like regulatory domain-containing protein, partial [Bacteroidia bacterium]|nr:carboxypeptidase-like regulatory domain-containing protein [Bacteroidia bacterium]
MDNIQFNQLNMFRAVSKHASNSQLITNTILAFKNGITALNVKITAIQTTSGEQDLAITGVTTNKNQLQETLVQSTFSVISPVKAYAVSINDTTLEAQMNLSVTELRETNDDQIGQKAQTLLNIVNLLIAVLADYGITPAIILSWQQDITNYLNALANPRMAVVHRATLTGELVTLFSEANAILKKTLDPISISFKAANPHYLSDYQKAREIIDLGTGTTRVKGICTLLSPDGEPVYNATVKINEQNIETTTDVLGLYALEPDTAPATITLTISGATIQTQTTPPFEIKQGESIIKNFVLQPA